MTVTGVRLVPVDDAVLDLLVAAATTDAAADEVTPPVTAGPGWTPERVAWLRAHHVGSRGGLDGPARGGDVGGAAVDDDVVGAVRLARTEVDGVVETGLWLTRGARGRGRAAEVLRLVLEQAAARGRHHGPSGDDGRRTPRRWRCCVGPASWCVLTRAVRCAPSCTSGRGPVGPAEPVGQG